MDFESFMEERRARVKALVAKWLEARKIVENERGGIGKVLNSYGSIYALGHKAVAGIFDGEVEITEKIDGSQCSFGVIDGELQIRSKNQQLHTGAGHSMFDAAIERIEAQAHLLHPNWIYRGEYLMKPKHNTLAYLRVPSNHIIIYDIEIAPGSEDYLLWAERKSESFRVGFETVPTFYDGICSLDHVKAVMDTESVLGGVKIEGVVVKNYAQFSEDKKIAKAKFVSPQFQEKHQKEWKQSNPGRQDVIEEIIESYRTDARWRKAIQHLRDDGLLEASPRDIGNLIKETQRDVLEEEADTIKDVLFNRFKGQIARGVVRGLPDAYKLWLAEGEVQ